MYLVHIHHWLCQSVKVIYNIMCPLDILQKKNSSLLSPNKRMKTTHHAEGPHFTMSLDFWSKYNNCFWNKGGVEVIGRIHLLVHSSTNNMQLPNALMQFSKHHLISWAEEMMQKFKKKNTSTKILEEHRSWRVMMHIFAALCSVTRIWQCSICQLVMRSPHPLSMQLITVYLSPWKGQQCELSCPQTQRSPRMCLCEILLLDWSLSWRYWRTDCCRRRIDADR